MDKQATINWIANEMREAGIGIPELIEAMFVPLSPEQEAAWRAERKEALRILAECRDRAIELRVEDGRVRWTAHAERMPVWLLKEIKAHGGAVTEEVESSKGSEAFHKREYLQANPGATDADFWRNFGEYRRRRRAGVAAGAEAWKRATYSPRDQWEAVDVA